MGALEEAVELPALHLLHDAVAIAAGIEREANGAAQGRVDAARHDCAAIVSVDLDGRVVDNNTLRTSDRTVRDRARQRHSRDQ